MTALLMTVYSVYHYLAETSVAAIEQYWPRHPRLVIGKSQRRELPARLLEDLLAIDDEFVVVMHEDYRLCGEVKQDLFDLALEAMQNDSRLLSCSMTWEPSDIGCYHFPKLYRSASFQELPRVWNYTVNLQIRIWRRKELAKILEQVPAKTSNSDLEPLLTKLFRDTTLQCITYAFPNPPEPSTFPDSTDKSDWIIPYDNVMHAQQRWHFKYPVYINNRDRLTTTRNMVDFLHHIPDAYPIVVDNGSTYPPLLEWYDTMPCNVISLGNVGPWAPWTLKEINRSRDYYAVTDSDLDLTGVPLDFLEHLQTGLDKYPKIIKAGLSLEINDLPEESHVARDWEKQFWKRALCPEWFLADVDTTLALYRSNTRVRPGVMPAVRSNRPYTARHVPWYCVDSDEERYYAAHANHEWSTWTGCDMPIEERPAYQNHLKRMPR